MDPLKTGNRIPSHGKHSIIFPLTMLYSDYQHKELHI